LAQQLHAGLVEHFTLDICSVWPLTSKGGVVGHQIKKKYTEKTPGGILPDCHVIVCTCEAWKEKATTEALIISRFENHQRYPEKTARFL
jgi:hypothetical protein